MVFLHVVNTTNTHITTFIYTFLEIAKMKAQILRTTRHCLEQYGSNYETACLEFKRSEQADPETAYEAFVEFLDQEGYINSKDACNILRRIFLRQQLFELLEMNFKAEAVTKFQELQKRIASSGCNFFDHIDQIIEKLPKLGFATPQQARKLTAIGNYLKVKELGRGGMGTCLILWDIKLNRKVVGKTILSQSMDPGAMTRFQKEMEATAKLTHAHIARAYGAEQDSQSGELCLILELINGIPLSKAVKDRSFWNVDQALELFLQLCEAVAYLHSLGLIHRDLKPDNIILGHDNMLYLLDFGIAKNLHAQEKPVEVKEINYDTVANLNKLLMGDTAAEVPGKTLDGAIVGTPGYLAPEQALGDNENVDEQSDQFALGLILFEMLRGKAAIMGDTFQARCLNVVEGNFETTIFGLPREVQSILNKMLSVEKENRYQHVREAIDDIKRFRAHHVVLAHDYSKKEKIKRWLKNNAVITFITLAVLVLILGFGAILKFQGEQAQARIAAERKEKLSKAEKLRRVSEELRKKQDKELLIFATYKKARPYLEQADEMYARYRKPRECLKLYEMVFKIYKDSGLWFHQPYRARFNAGFIYNYIENPQKAIENYKIADQLHRKENHKPYIKALLYIALQEQSLASYYGKKGKLEEARKHFEQIKKLEGRSEQDAVQIGLADAYDLWIQHSSKKTAQERLPILEKAMRVLEGLKNNTQLDVFFEYFKMRGRIQSEIYRMKFFLKRKPGPELLRNARTDFMMAWRYSTNNEFVVSGLAQTCQRLGLHYFRSANYLLAIRYYNEAAHFYNLCHEINSGRHEYQVRYLFAKSRWAQLLRNIALMEDILKEARNLYPLLKSNEKAMRKLLAKDTAIWLIKYSRSKQLKEKYYGYWQNK